jgi:hypothetical protein
MNMTAAPGRTAKTLHEGTASLGSGYALYDLVQCC